MILYNKRGLEYGVRAPVFCGSLREQPGENGFPRLRARLIMNIIIIIIMIITIMILISLILVLILVMIIVCTSGPGTRRRNGE